MNANFSKEENENIEAALNHYDDGFLDSDARTMFWDIATRDPMARIPIRRRDEVTQAAAVAAYRAGADAAGIIAASSAAGRRAARLADEAELIRRACERGADKSRNW